MAAPYQSADAVAKVHSPTPNEVAEKIVFLAVNDDDGSYVREKWRPEIEAGEALIRGLIERVVLQDREDRKVGADNVAKMNSAILTARQAGWTAHHAGETLGDNPHEDMRGSLHFDWQRGWQAAQRGKPQPQ